MNDKTSHSTEKDQSGLEGRYQVEKINDPDGKHDDCRYFVLDPQHDAHAATALRAYAAAVGGPLADDIAGWLRRLNYCLRCSQVRGHRGPCSAEPDWHCERCGLHRDEHRLGAAADQCVFDPELRNPPGSEDRRPCKGQNGNVCVAEGCYGEACLSLPPADGGAR